MQNYASSTCLKTINLGFLILLILYSTYSDLRWNRASIYTDQWYIQHWFKRFHNRQYINVAVIIMTGCMHGLIIIKICVWSNDVIIADCTIYLYQGLCLALALLSITQCGPIYILADKMCTCIVIRDCLHCSLACYTYNRAVVSPVL